MFTKRRVGMGVCAGVAALALAVTVGPLRSVWADLGISGVINVEITDPEGFELNVFAPDADVPDRLEVGISSVVRPEADRGGLSVDDIDSVSTVLGGELDDAGVITDELDDTEATLVNESGSTSEYVAVLDLTNLDYENISRGDITGLIAEDVIRTVAIVDGYYESRDVRDIVEADEIDVAVQIRDSADIDEDGNGLPDASALLDNDNFILIGANGTITIVSNLDLSGRGVTEAVVDHYYESQFGPVLVTVESPTLEALQLADNSFDAFDTARLIITISEDSSDLVDEPSSFSPVADFDLVDGDDEPLPAPENLFVRVVIAVTDASRGTIPDWTFVGDLPGGLELIGELSGPGIAENLEDGTDVDAYSYTITMVQDDEEITAESDDDSEWAEADEITVSNQDSADDEDDSRDAVEADDGDDTVRATFLFGSAIFGSNVTPRVGGGGGGGGSSGCFIATAAYGTPMAKEIQALRDVRDTYLIDTALGSAFVDAYYRISPPIARMVSESPAAKTAVRVALTPVVTVSEWSMEAPGLVGMGALMVLLAGAMMSVRIKRRTI